MQGDKITCFGARERESDCVHEKSSRSTMNFLSTGTGSLLKSLPSDGVKVSDFLNRVLGSGSSSAGKESSEKSQIFDISSSFVFIFQTRCLDSWIHQD